jgi:hypothetical protein
MAKEIGKYDLGAGWLHTHIRYPDVSIYFDYIFNVVQKLQTAVP